MSLLEVNDVWSGYGRREVLHGLSLGVERGEIVAVIGPNGAGKSTMMKTIFRLLRPVSGSVSFDGRDLTRHHTRELSSLGMGYVPQEGNTFPELSVDDNLGVSLPNARRYEVTKRRDAIYAEFPPLAARRRSAAGMLSGGERQMLAFGSALITSPSFLALDEPTTGLAPSIVDDLIDRIAEYRDGGGGVLWVVEDNPLQVLHHADRVYVMSSGVVERELDPRESLPDQLLRDLFFGTSARP